MSTADAGAEKVLKKNESQRCVKGGGEIDELLMFIIILRVWNIISPLSHPLSHCWWSGGVAGW